MEECSDLSTQVQILSEDELSDVLKEAVQPIGEVQRARHDLKPRLAESTICCIAVHSHFLDKRVLEMPLLSE